MPIFALYLFFHPDLTGIIDPYASNFKTVDGTYRDKFLINMHGRIQRHKYTTDRYGCLSRSLSMINSDLCGRISLSSNPNPFPRPMRSPRCSTFFTLRTEIKYHKLFEKSIHFGMQITPEGRANLRNSRDART